MPFCKKYKLAYPSAEARKQAKHQKIKEAFSRLSKHLPADDAINWIADRYFIGPKYVEQILKK